MSDDEPRRWDALNPSERQCLRMIRRYRDGEEDPELGEAFQFPAAVMQLMARKLTDAEPVYPPIPEVSVPVYMAKVPGVPLLALALRTMVATLREGDFLIVPPRRVSAVELEAENEVQA